MSLGQAALCHHRRSQGQPWPKGSMTGSGLQKDSPMTHVLGDLWSYGGLRTVDSEGPCRPLSSPQRPLALHLHQGTWPWQGRAWQDLWVAGAREGHRGSEVSLHRGPGRHTSMWPPTHSTGPHTGLGEGSQTPNKKLACLFKAGHRQRPLQILGVRRGVWGCDWDGPGALRAL